MSGEPLRPWADFPYPSLIPDDIEVFHGEIENNTRLLSFKLKKAELYVDFDNPPEGDLQVFIERNIGQVASQLRKRFN